MAMAAFFEYTDLLLILISLIPLYLFCKSITSSSSTSRLPTNWPLFGMTPGLVHNAHRIHEFATDVVKEAGGTFLLKGPLFANMDLFITSDPANVHHMLSKNFPNYPKGPEFRKNFDILGDGIFNSDFELWEIHRKTTMSLFNHAKFHALLERTVWGTVEQGLVPVLDYMSEQGAETDLQDIFQRFTFDGICKMVLDCDPRSLATDLPYIPAEKGFTDTEEALLYRHIFPEKIWRLQSWLQIGKEKKLSQAWKAFDEFIYKCISRKQEELNCATNGDATNNDLNLLTEFMTAYKDIKGNFGSSKKFLRDTLLSLMVAGRDTTSTGLSWFFFLLAKNPSVVAKIREEIRKVLVTEDGGEKMKSYFGVDELRKMVYLHGALCEALRLFPPVAIEHKAPSQPDILPSGHHVDPDTKIFLSFYSMGRMESLWGKDCLEFKPERWISERGSVKHEPSYKFTAFHAGPRTCIGKEMAFIQMKIVATVIIWDYGVELVEGHVVCPSDSIILQMKNGLKVRLTKRK